MSSQAPDLPVHRRVFRLHGLMPLRGDETDAQADGRQPLVGVVLPVQQPVFRPGGHHPVGLVGALGHQIVDEGADIALAAAQDQGLPPLELQGGVDPGHKALDRRLLIAGGAVELPRAVEAGDLLALQGGQQLRGVHAVVFDGVGGAGHLRLLQAGEGVEHFDLHVLRQGGGEALDVQLLGVQPHGLHKELVPGLVGKADDLGLDGGAVSGAYALDDAGDQGAPVQVGPDDGVGGLVGVGQVAHRPILRRGFGGEGEGLRLRVPLLQLHFGEVHAPGVDPGRGAGLEPAQPQAQGPQAVGQGGPPRPSGPESQHLPHDGAAAQIGAGGQDHRPASSDRPGGGADPAETGPSSVPRPPPPPASGADSPAAPGCAS